MKRPDPNVVDWAYHVMLNPTPLSYNEARLATEIVHDDAQWREVGVREALRERATLAELDEAVKG